MDNLVIALPRVAPLPVAMVLHTLGLSEQTFITAYQRSGEQLEQRMLAFEQRITTALHSVYALMVSELAQRQKIRLPWFQSALSEQLNKKDLLRHSMQRETKGYSASNRTLLTWRNNAILLPERSRALDLDRVAAILAIAMIDDRKQGFLPTALNPDEPQKWCFAKTSPHVPIVPCPLPIPPDLPRGTVLFSAWQSFDEGWLWLHAPGANLAPLPINRPIGAIRFSSIDFASLARWDESIINPEAQLIFGYSRQKELPKLAEKVLYRLAPTLFLDSSQASLPLVYHVDQLYSALFH